MAHLIKKNCIVFIFVVFRGHIMAASFYINSGSRSVGSCRYSFHYLCRGALTGIPSRAFNGR